MTACTPTPNLSDHATVGPRRHSRKLCSLEPSPHRPVVALERDERSGVKDEGHPVRARPTATVTMGHTIGGAVRRHEPIIPTLARVGGCRFGGARCHRHSAGAGSAQAASEVAAVDHTMALEGQQPGGEDGYTPIDDVFVTETGCSPQAVEGPGQRVVSGNFLDAELADDDGERVSRLIKLGEVVRSDTARRADAQERPGPPAALHHPIALQ